MEQLLRSARRKFASTTSFASNSFNSVSAMYGFKLEAHVPLQTSSVAFYFLSVTWFTKVTQKWALFNRAGHGQKLFERDAAVRPFDANFSSEFTFYTRLFSLPIPRADSASCLLYIERWTFTVKTAKYLSTMTEIRLRVHQIHLRSSHGIKRHIHVQNRPPFLTLYFRSYNTIYSYNGIATDVRMPYLYR